MTRDRFALLAAAVLLGLLFLIVVRPAVERGGVGEIAVVAAVFIAILLAERWLRGR